MSKDFSSPYVEAPARAGSAEETRLRLALDAANLGTWERNLLTGEDFWSAQQEALFGLAPGQFASAHSSFIAMVHPDDRDAIEAAARRAIDEGQPYRSEYRIVRPDGRISWMLGRGDVVRDADGRPTRMHGITVDITDRKLAEEERSRLLAAEKLAREEAESANRLKDEFLAVVSHELRTPLNAILGWAQLLIRDRSDPAELAHGLYAIERNSRSMAQLVEDVLDVSRIIRGKLRLNIRPSDVSVAIEAAIAAVRPAAVAKNIRIERQIDPKIHLINSDQDRLQQVLWNLLSNAIKFTPAGGRVRVQLECFEGHIRIDVIDSGIGIPREFLPHVFERFTQADTTTRRANAGLGLGLAIVRHLVELHGGTVQAASDGEGMGSTFGVTLPIQCQSSDSAETSTGQADSGSSAIPHRAGLLDGLSVLVVDDEADARELATAMLKRAGATVMTAGSVDEAIRAVRADPPDVLISDIGMPGRDGFDLLRELKQLRSELDRPLPAAATTGFASADDRERVVRSGFALHLAKPLEWNAVVDAVLTLSGRKR